MLKIMLLAPTDLLDHRAEADQGQQAERINIWEVVRIQVFLHKNIIVLNRYQT